MPRGQPKQPRQGPALALCAVCLGALAGASASGLALALSIVLTVWVLLFPIAGVLGNLALRPLIDVFWNQRIVEVGSIHLNPQSVVGVAVPLAIGLVLLIRGWIRRPRPVEIALLAYVLISFAGVALGSSKAFGDLARIVLPLTFYWLGLQWPPLTRALLPLMFVLSLYGLIPVASALFQFTHLTGPVAGAVGNPTGVYRVTGFYHHPLEIAMRCCISIPFALAAASLIRSQVERRATYLWAAVLSLFSIATLVRSALVVTTAEICHWHWHRGRRVLVVISLVAAVLLSFALPPVRSVLQNAWRPFQEGNLYELGTGRALLFVAQVYAFERATPSQKLLGRGLHSTPGVNLQFAPTAALDPSIVDPESGNVGAHNQYLRVLTESGIVGTAAFLLALLLLFRMCARVRARSRLPVETAFASATATALMGVVVYGFTATPFDSPSISWPIWIALGCVGGFDARLGSDPPPEGTLAS
jgi:hypothetical protein